MRDKIHITKHHAISRLEKRAKIVTYSGLGLAIATAVLTLSGLASGQLDIYQVIYLAIPIIFLCCYLIGLLDADFIIYKDSISKELQGKEVKESSKEQP